MFFQHFAGGPRSQSLWTSLERTGVVDHLTCAVFRLEELDPLSALRASAETAYYRAIGGTKGRPRARRYQLCEFTFFTSPDWARRISRQGWQSTECSNGADSFACRSS